jgi:tetratricopeptide (TPR) repeat protein
MVLSAVALYAITAFLFSSFTRRRAELGKQFAQSGKISLTRGDNAQAVHDLRISLSYAPDDADTQLLLARALAQTNHWQEARGYLLSLVDVQPADGYINLQLARLSRRRSDVPRAIQYYRAAAVGNWHDAPLDARFQTQLELSNYLIAQHRLPSARAELLIAAADAPPTDYAYSQLGDSFLEVNDRPGAANEYEKAVKVNPDDVTALLKAANVLFQTARYAEAESLLSEARRTIPHKKFSEAQSIEFQTLLENSRRVQQLTVGQELPARERNAHLLTDLSIAGKRFAACRAKLDDGNAIPAAMQSLDAQWHASAQLMRGPSALDNQADEASMTKLVFDTEQVTRQFCGPPTGDDALLSGLANAQSSQH